MKNKKLIIAIDRIFSEYYIAIEKRLLKNFKEVLIVNRNGVPVKKNITNIFIKNLEKIGFLGKKISKFLIKKEVSKIKSYDYLLSIGGECLSKNILNEIRKNSPTIKCVKYIFDKTGEAYIKGAQEKYDEIYTFEKDDSKEFNLKFRPSFFVDDAKEEKKEIDCYYLGALREKKRYDFIESFKSYCLKNKLSYDFNLFIKKKYLNDNYNDQEILTFEKMTYRENIEKVRKSKVVIELNYYTQKGLTLRTFECLASNTKLITENKEIVNYDFYNPKNIFVVDSIEDIDSIPKKFFQCDYEKVDKNIVDRYSIEGFVKEVLTS